MPAADENNLKEKIRRISGKPGVYVMRGRLGDILYVGKAKNLRKRVQSYFQAGRRLKDEQPKIAAMVQLVRDIETLEVKTEAEAALLEGRLIKEWKPKYNTVFTDDKRFLMIRVDLQNPMPRFQLVRNRRGDSARYFGPFANAGAVRRTLDEIRKEFGVVLSDARPMAVGEGLYRLYDDMRAEIYGHPNELTEEAYRDRVEKACAFLEGKARVQLEALKEKMQKAAVAKRYEEAASLRDLVVAVKETISRERRFTGVLRDESLRPEVSMKELGEAIGLKGDPRHIECFDISHVSGSYVVASMVCFREGVPSKKDYRRFRIREFIGNDDYRAMEEVVGRRYSRLKDEGVAMPDLIVIDGGAGQVTAAMKAFIAKGLELPPLIGLAKKQETIVFSDGRSPLNLKETHAGLRLLQRLRDEAHRFANAYNADLRSRKIRESIMDDFPGLGEKRKAALLGYFGGIERLKKADRARLMEVEGIGPKLSEELYAFFRRH